MGSYCVRVENRRMSGQLPMPHSSFGSQNAWPAEAGRVLGAVDVLVKKADLL
jgi:hypothetical protein